MNWVVLFSVAVSTTIKQQQKGLVSGKLVSSSRRKICIYACVLIQIETECRNNNQLQLQPSHSHSAHESQLVAQAAKPWRRVLPVTHDQIWPLSKSYIKLQFVLHRKSVSIAQDNRLMMFREIICIYCENGKIYRNTLPKKTPNNTVYYIILYLLYCIY